jgi:hypothetical protein
MRDSIVRWLAALVLSVIVAACSRGSIVAGPEIETINPVIGDASYVAAFGRLPTAADDPTERVRTHLAYVEARLRARDVSNLSPAARAARTRTLDHLRAYWRRGEFPASDAKTGLLPTFIDDRGVRCAVAYLAEQETGAAAIEALNRRHRNAYIAQIDAHALAAWASTSGLTRDELSMIQPAYPPRPRYPNVDLKITADYRYSVDEDQAPGPLSHLAMLRGDVRWTGRHNYWIGSPILGLSGGVGWADRDHLAYDAHLLLGSYVNFQFPGGTKHLLGFTAGLGVDAVGDRIARAWTVPIDAFYYVGKASGGRARVGAVGGPRFNLGGRPGGGSDNETHFGWRAGVAIVSRDVWDSSNRFAPRDIHVELAVERVADATFVGLSLSIATRSAFGWWNRT